MHDATALASRAKEQHCERTSLLPCSYRRSSSGCFWEGELMYSIFVCELTPVLESHPDPACQHHTQSAKSVCWAQPDGRRWTQRGFGVVGHVKRQHMRRQQS